jgi:PAS domain-containing protein
MVATMPNSPEERDAEEGRIQSSVRLPASLFQKLRENSTQSGESINAQIEAAVAEKVGGMSELTGRRKKGRKSSLQATIPTGTQERASTANPVEPRIVRLREYLRWVPAVAVIRDLDGRTALANHELKRLLNLENVVGLRPSDYWEPSVAELVEANDQIVRVKNVAIICVERIPIRHTFRERLSVRFPIRDREGAVKMTGVLGFDLEQLRDAQALKSRDGGRRPSRFEANRHVVYLGDLEQAAADAFLSDFLYWVPAIATIKDPNGRLLCVNHKYYSVTKKTDDVIGKLPSENWPASTADLITAHDQLVRETKTPFVSVETLELSEQSLERLTFRFPILGSQGEIEMMGTLGFDLGLITRAISELAKPGDFLIIPEPAADSKLSDGEDAPS